MAFIPGLGALGMAASGAGAGLSAFGALSKGSAEAGQMTYLAAVARANKKIAEQNAAYERGVGEVKAGQYGLKSAFQRGSIEVAQAASGLDINKGSAAAVQRSQKLTSDADMGMIRNNAARLAYGYDIQAAQQEQQAGLYEVGAENAKKASYINAFGSILGGVSSVSSKWLQGNSLGMWDTNTESYAGIPFAPDDL